MKEKRWIWGVVILLWVAFAGNIASGDVVVVKKPKGGVLIENSKFKGAIDRKGVVTASSKAMPGSLDRVAIRNQKGDGVARAKFDGSVDDMPSGLITPNTFKTETKVLEEGPIRGVVVVTLSGQGKPAYGFDAGTKVKIERKFIISVDSELIATEAIYKSDKKFPAKMFSRYVYPHANLGMSIPPSKERVDSFKYVMSNNKRGDVVWKTIGNWLNVSTRSGKAWIQFYLPSDETGGKAICFGYLLPKGTLRNSNRRYRSGDDAVTFCQLALINNFRNKREFRLPVTFVISDSTKDERSDDYVVASYAKKYKPDGSPRGLNISTDWREMKIKGQIKKIRVMTIKEVLGLERNNEVLEFEVETEGDDLYNAVLLDDGFDAAAGVGKNLMFQLKHNDPTLKTIVFNAPKIKAGGETQIFFVPGGIK